MCKFEMPTIHLIKCLNEIAQALQQIATKQNITRWEAGPDTCVPDQRNKTREKTGNITCNCTVTCHIIKIKLVRLKLSGDLPLEFLNFTYLREIDLTGNVFNGTIPSEWAKLNLTSLSLGRNNISGTIPKEIGDISTLEELNLEDNKLIGDLPPELGNLIRLKKAFFSGNNFTGPLPGTLAKLQKLTDFEIRGTKISGKIPEFIGDWTNLNVLDLQGTSMTGSIPSTISRLTNLTRLMISDLNASAMPFPDLRNLVNLKILVLRKCEITGSIPSYIGEKMQDMTNLDLSFNKMNGSITESLANLTNLKFMYLTNNSLTGKIPSWLHNEGNNYDISYNKFTGGDGNCNNTKVLNLISSYSSVKEDAIDDDDQWCLTEGLQCFHKPRYYELFINCGGGEKEQFEDDDDEDKDNDNDNDSEDEGDEEDEEKEKSEEDENSEDNDYDYDDVKKDKGKWGPSTFVVSKSGRWAFSSMGDYMGSKGARYRQSSSRENSTSDISTTVRLAPISLKYYGLCLRNGNYTVTLHFNEIVLPRKGRRIFDIYIQGERVEKDFNIAVVAGGINIPINRTYHAMVENTSTLEIHLYWAGKGTMSVARGGQYGQYGPLISGISITPDFNPHPGLSAGAISGIVVASLVGFLLIAIVLRMKGYLGGKDVVDEELRGLELQTGYFSLRQIKNATDNFSSANKIGQGGFGAVYKGTLTDGSEIAVKQLSSKSRQGNREFLTEIGMLSALQHPHLVKLFGCCIEGNQLLIIYEYMENNSLARALFGPKEGRLNLDWPTRQKICVGIARGLVYLHEESILKIVHRDMKTTNVLLDKELNAKICDFGLAKLDEEEDTHISTRIAGTVGYMAPEYAMRGYLTEKADVYSFGIVALEIVSGKSNTNYRPKQEFMYLLDWACVLQEQGNLLQLVDECLGRNYSKKEALNMLNIGLMCTNISPTLRPTMSAVVSMLEGDTPVEPTHFVGGSVSAHMKLKVLENNSQESHTQTSLYPRDSLTQSISEDGPFVDFSSISLSDNGVSKSYSSTAKLLPDLYDVHLPK